MPRFLATYYPFVRSCPTRPADWRWWWSQQIVGGGRPRPDGIDAVGLVALQLAQHVQGGGECVDLDGQLAGELAALAIYREILRVGRWSRLGC